MKFEIQMKDPDGVFSSLIEEGMDLGDLPVDVARMVRKYIEFDEYLTVEFDTEADTVRVVPVDRSDY